LRQKNFSGFLTRAIKILSHSAGSSPTERLKEAKKFSLGDPEKTRTLGLLLVKEPEEVLIPDSSFWIILTESVALKSKICEPSCYCCKGVIGIL